MSRDFVLAALVLISCGSLACLAGFLPSRAEAPAPSEPRAWRLVWAPLAPAAAALALLIGWALHEPSVTDEILSPTALVLAAPLAAMWLRAALRAAAALRASARGLTAGVVGLLRPRVVIDPRFRAALDTASLEAVLAHERAHARHRDPLRIWLAQLATDLQGPTRAARARLAAWTEALETSRDDEARREGIHGEDLANALVVAARAAAPRRPAAVATFGSPEASLTARVDRLLAPLERAAPPRASLAIAALAAVVAAAALVGWMHGDLFVRALPFVTS
jgi:beta-lactamase regulating signal transducer with metallopeptidase domain